MNSSHANMKTKIEALIAKLESQLNPYMARVMESYYGVDDGDFSDYSSGNFDDDVELGNSIGTYETLQEVISELKEVLK